jgi:16S rRNA C1402 N4-methylase RsmH
VRQDDEQCEPGTSESRVPNAESRVLHVPVLVRETLEFLNVRPEGIYIDATLGGGGHSLEILQRLESGRLLSLDRDPRALEVAGTRLAGSTGILRKSMRCTPPADCRPSMA